MVGAVGVENTSSVLIVSSMGVMKRLAVDKQRQCTRGNIGQIGANLKQQSDKVVELSTNQDLAGVRLDDGRTCRIFCEDLNFEKVDTIGNSRIIELVPLKHYR